MSARFIDHPDFGRIVRDWGDPEAEARACRADCALFDYSFLARVRLQGSGAAAAIGAITPRPVHDLAEGRVRYAVRVDDKGQLVSDLTVWRDYDGYEVMSGSPADAAFLKTLAGPDCDVRDLTAQSAVFAVQGPGTLAALARLGKADTIAALPYFGFCRVKLAGQPAIVGRLGYTGEPGVEIIIAREAAPALWSALAEQARPAGFAAADILRQEAGFVLFTNEFRLPVHPLEAGLARFGTPSGSSAPADAIRLCCFRLDRRHRPVLWRGDQPLQRPAAPGAVTVTSACWSIAESAPIALGFARVADLEAGLPLYDAGGSFGGLTITTRPLVDPQKTRPRRWR